MNNSKNSWDIFCKVIDNYGDIGVCWRLAKILANEYNLTINLWVDNLSAFAQIEKKIDKNTISQICEQVNIFRWEKEVFNGNTSVIIEAFACSLSDEFIKQLAENKKKNKHQPLWINLEYLTYENWAKECHRLPSPQNINRVLLDKYFFFSGADFKLGGVNFEKDIFNLCEKNQQNLRLKLTNKLNIVIDKNTKIVLMFAYQNAPIKAFINYLVNSNTPTLLLIPAEKFIKNIISEICETGNINILQNRQEECHTITLAKLTIKLIPFCQQQEFDEILAAADINFVRGEDSFVRAQLVGKPFIWQVYPQENNTHLLKLQSFLDNYLQNADDELKMAITNFSQKWNQQEFCEKSWKIFIQNQQKIIFHNHKWQEKIKTIGSLAENLINFANSHSNQ